MNEQQPDKATHQALLEETTPVKFRCKVCDEIIEAAYGKWGQKALQHYREHVINGDNTEDTTTYAELVGPVFDDPYMICVCGHNGGHHDSQHENPEEATQPGTDECSECACESFEFDGYVDEYEQLLNELGIDPRP